MVALANWGMFFSVLLCLWGMAWLGHSWYRYIIQRTFSDVSGKVTIIAFVAALVVFILSQALYPIGPHRWFVAWLSLMIFIITTIICYICDTRHGYAAEVKLGFRSHFMMILAAIAFVGSRWSTDYLEDFQIAYMYKNGEVKTIDCVKTIIEKEMQYESFDTSNGTITYPTVRKDIEKVYLFTTDGLNTHIGGRIEGINYDKLYPKGDTITLYKNELIKPRF